MSKIVYDLTEVFLASTGKLRYYGILRVVAEVGMGLRRLDPSIRFVVYSYALHDFVEVMPIVSEDGIVTLNVPLGIRQVRLRRKYYNRNHVRDLIMVPIRRLVDRRNLRAWEAAGLSLPRIDMEGAILVSCGRPKLMVDELDGLDRQQKNILFVPLLHDMIPLHDRFTHRRASFSGNFLGDNQTVIARAALILTNSEFTRSEVLHFYERGVLPRPPKIVAVPLVHECPEGHEVAQTSPPNEPYILSVGASIGRKNLDVVFEALAALARAGARVPTFVLAGAPRESVRKFLEAERFAPIRHKVVFRANPNQTDLVALYRGATALVIASRMEGWGLPAGEALWLGTPAICSTAPVFREVCGDLGIYFDPDDADALASIIRCLMEDNGFRNDLHKRIVEAKDSLRTWQTVSEDVLAALRLLQAEG